MSTDHSSVFAAYRLPASLRPVCGVPALRLLRKLRPWCRPYLAIAASPVSDRADDPSSRAPIFNLLPLGGELYPVRCWRWGIGASPISGLNKNPAVRIDEPYRL